MATRILAWIAIIGVGIGALYAFELARVPCREALAYSVGQFDIRFGISETDFRIALAEAEQPWEAALGRDLFRYDPQALFPVNLIFDERQQRTIDGQKLDSEWAAVQSKQTSIKGRYDVFSSELEKTRRDYDAFVATFEKRLAQYNARVNEWNSGPRTNENDLEWLQAEAKALKRDKAVIETKRGRVNALVAEVNRSAKEEERVVERFNAQVETFTEQYGSEGEFDQGIYDGASINIYQFDNRDHLRMVLVHELGHALGIDHVTNARSIMYPVMGVQDVQNLQLSNEDRSALAAACAVTAWDLMLRDTREAWSLVSR
ncbi:MAG: matrixin family metalloprotease [Candidatus Moraniibacteriota bacterium]